MRLHYTIALNHGANGSLYQYNIVVKHGPKEATSIQYSLQSWGKEGYTNIIVLNHGATGSYINTIVLHRGEAYIHSLVLWGGLHP